MQMHPPKIRHVQVPAQRANSVGSSQIDGAQDRRYSAQQAQNTPSAKRVNHPQAHQENGPRPQQRPPSTPVQSQSQHRAPLQPQSTPQQQRPHHTSQQSSISRSTPQHQNGPPLVQTPSSQHRTASVQQSATKKAHPQVVIPRSSTHQLTPTKHPQPPPKNLPVDCSVVLLSAADEYVAAARSMSGLILRGKKEADLQQYYKLMATGMACMDAVLKNFSMLPRDEARLRLRYASLLVEETDNTTEIDDVLSKQITLCKRSRLPDLHYASLHLQVRYQFKTNHHAALKALKDPIKDTVAFFHTSWEYAFRFLKVSLLLQIPGRVETVPVLQELHHIQNLAEKQADRAVFVASSALEAIVHLRSGTSDRLEQARRAIAAARSLQLQVSAEQLGSFGVLIDIVDIACGIQAGTPNNKKSAALIEAMVDDATQSLRSETGVFTVVIERTFGGSMTLDTGGIFGKNSEGRDEIVFAWLPKEDLKTLCFHISALDQHVHEKGFIYIKEAHQRSRSAVKNPPSYSLPVNVAFAQTDWNRVLDWHSMFSIGVLACSRGDHVVAKEALVILRKRATKSPYNSQDTYTRHLAYLSAIIDQTIGDIDSALRTYCSEHFQLPKNKSISSPKVDLGILAALNRLLIIRQPGHPQNMAVGALISELQQFCENHCNQYLHMAYRLINAMCSSEDSIVRRKTLMQNASTRANEILKTTQNREFVCMALCYFTMSFFAGEVGGKPIQAIRATQQNAKLSRKPLWIAVALGLCMSTYEKNGMFEEAQKSRQEFEELRGSLPAALTGRVDAHAEGDEDEDAEGDSDLEA